MSGPSAFESTRFAVIIVNYGSSALLESGAARLALPANGTVVLVDCFSDVDERARVAALAERHGWTSVLLDRNAGFGGGSNAGAQVALRAGAQVLVFLNPDAQIDRASLAALVSTAATDPCTLVSPRIVTGDGGAWFAGADLYLDDGTTAGAVRRARNGHRPRREWATGACFAVSAPLWERVGGFDEEYFLYWEDIDFSHRVLDAGGRLLLLEEARAVHDEGGTHGDAVAGRAKSETYYYHNIRNRLLYAAKHLDDEDLAAWLRSAPRVAYRVLLQGGRRQLLTSIAPWRAYARGLRDGRRVARRPRATPAGSDPTRR
jgi:N-acetylglucosaminyl-diphospho-decaprenol L-rhamnosyltransferase